MIDIMYSHPKNFGSALKNESAKTFLGDCTYLSPYNSHTIGFKISNWELLYLKLPKVLFICIHLCINRSLYGTTLIMKSTSVPILSGVRATLRDAGYMC